MHQITLALAFLTVSGLLGSAPIKAQAGCETLIGNYSFPVVGLATFDNLDDGYCAVVVGLSNGSVREVFFRPENPDSRGDSEIYRVNYYLSGIRLTALSGYYALDTGYRTVLVGTNTGQLYEVKYHPYRPKEFAMTLVRHPETMKR